MATLADVVASITSLIDVVKAANPPAPPPATPTPPSTFAKGLAILGEGFPKASKAIGDFVGAIQGWKDRLGARGVAGNAMSTIGASLGMAKSVALAPATAATGLVGGLTAAAQGPVGMLNDMFGGIARMVGMMNPAAVEMFNRAMADLQAVMGEILLPILQAGTGLVRKFADVILTMKPAFDPIIQVAVDLVNILADLLVPVFKVLTPLIQLFGAIAQSLMPVMNLIVDALKWLLKGMETFVRGFVEIWNGFTDTMIGRALGLKTVNLGAVNLDQTKSSMGKAIYQTGFASAEQLGKDTRAKALMTGDSDAKKTADNTKMTADTVKEIKDAVLEMKVRPPGFVGGLESIIPSAGYPSGGVGGDF